MEVKHETTPFKLDGLWLETAFNVPIFELSPVVGRPEQHKENAEFIVRACNSHYDLLDALRDLVSACARYDEQDEHSDLLAANYCAAKDRAIAALAKAEVRS